MSSESKQNNGIDKEKLAGKLNNNHVKFPRKTNLKILIGGIFLLTVGTVSSIFGFSRSLAASKKENINFVNEKVPNSLELTEEGARLALRALKWGTFFAFVGTGTICLTIWKLSGASNFREFREKMGSILPRLTSTDPPKSRTEFKNLTDLMTYLSTWGKEN
jgi:hypothetical protein